MKAGIRHIASTLLVFIATVEAADYSPAIPITSAALEPSQVMTRIAFGSCARPTQDQTIFTTIRNENPDVFLYIGDNVYADTEQDDPALGSLREAYGQLARSAPFSQLRRDVPLLVSWDDHDYGLNDAGGDWPHKEASLDLYRHVWDVRDERLERDGIYYSRISGADGRRVQFILLDTRYFRSPLVPASEKLPFGKYAQNTDKNATILGEAQWQWLDRELRRPAELRIIASSIQVLPTGHNFEAWHLFPAERERLFALLKRTRAGGVILLSGDRHSAAIYRNDDAIDYPLWEVTASSLNIPLSSFVSNIRTEPGEHRAGEPYYEANYGLIDIDWPRQRVIMQIRDDRGRAVLAATVSLDKLRAP